MAAIKAAKTAFCRMRQLMSGNLHSCPGMEKKKEEEEKMPNKNCFAEKEDRCDCTVSQSVRMMNSAK